MSRTYVILNATEADSINFNDVLETSSSTLRWNNPSQSVRKTFVKYEGSTPSWLSGKTTYTEAQILPILNDPEGEWFIEDD
tara:strand:- start:253 stop:495 length:243 start_codon:yes stop_codon:yes gene_type:complete